MPFVFYISLAFIISVALSSFLTTTGCMTLCQTLLITLLILLIKHRRLEKSNFKVYAITFALILGLIPMFHSEENRSTFTRHFQGDCIMYGRITEITDLENDTFRVTLNLKQIKNSSYLSKVNSKIYIYSSDEAFKNADFGNEAVLRGSLTFPEAAMNFGGFNLQRYYMSIGIVGTCSNPTDVKIYDGSFYPPDVIYKIRGYCKDALTKFVGGEASEFVSAVLLGDRSGFSEKLTENSRKIGISHVTAVSGMHVSILISLVLLLTKPFTKLRKVKAYAVICVLLFYVFLSGLSPSVIRATVMGCCVMSGVLTGRRTRPLCLLAMCAAVMLAINPFLLYNPSFMLSFISTCGLNLFLPLLQARFHSSSLLISTLFMTVIANISTLPYVLWNFDSYSWIGLLSNMLIVPLVSPVFICGFFTVVFAPIPTLASVFGAFTSGICSFIIDVSDNIALLPFGRLSIPLTNLLIVAAAYALVLMLYFMLKNKSKSVFICFILTASMLIGGTAHYIIGKQSFTVTQLYVGQGDSAVIMLPGGTVYLIDTGDVSASGYSRCLEYLHNNAVFQIEGIIISHEDSDHAGALEAIVSNINTKTVYVSQNSINTRDIGKITDVAAKYGCTVQGVSAGDSLLVNNARFDFIYPFANMSYTDSNNGSLVTNLSYRGRSFLFTGDISTLSEKKLLPYITDCDVLKVAHHGSSSSTSDAFLQAAMPEYALISAGLNNKYSHPHPSVRLRLRNRDIKTFVTYHSGAVRFKVSENGKLTYKNAVVQY